MLAAFACWPCCILGTESFSAASLDAVRSAQLVTVVLSSCGHHNTVADITQVPAEHVNWSGSLRGRTVHTFHIERHTELIPMLVARVCQGQRQGTPGR